MADQPLLILQKKADPLETESSITFGLSNSFVDEGYKLGISGNHDSLDLKNMSSTLIPGSEVIDTDQDRKRRCFDKLVVHRDLMMEENVEDVKCALKIEVIDDTALIEATAAVSGFKSCYGNETDVGYAKNLGDIGSWRNQKKEIDVKKRRNKGCKKQAKGCLMKCLNEKKLSGQTVEDENASQNVVRKTCGKVKVVYKKKDMKGSKSVASGVETVNLKIPNGNENQIVKKKDDEKKETEDGKKKVYSREEMEALRFVGEEEQKKKWSEVYGGLASSVAMEYTRLVVGQMQRYNRHAILSMPPVLPSYASRLNFH